MRSSRTILFARVIPVLIVLLIASVILAAGDESNSTDSNSTESNIADGNNTDANSTENNLANQSFDDSSLKTAEHDVHVYIINNDNERLKVSLFIDDELKESKELSTDTETKIDSYPLSSGPHRFKISWWDEDVKKSFDFDELKDITEETSVNLYTTLHDEPEKFDITVKLNNENDNALEAFLYVDGSFEKSKEVSKDSTADLGTIKLEEGVHNLSIKWQDTDTRIQYEKTKKITVTKEDAVVFYAPQGVSFEAEKVSSPPQKNAYSSTSSTTSSSTSSTSSLSTSSTTSSSTSSTSSPSTSSSTTASSNAAAASSTKAEDTTSAKTTDADNSSTSSSSSSLTSKASTDSVIKEYTASGDSHDTDSKEQTHGMDGKSGDDILSESGLDDSGKILLYAALVIVAVYLMLRH